MKTTLDLNDALLTEAKTYAAQQHTSLTRLIEEGLQLRLRKAQAPARRVRLPVYHGKGGLVPVGFHSDQVTLAESGSQWAWPPSPRSRTASSCSATCLSCAST